MKNAISNVWLIGLVTLFIFVFAGYLAVTINYTQTFKVKNEILTIIEKQKGVVNGANPSTSRASIINSGSTVYTGVGSLQIISLYLYGSGYRTMGACDMVSETNKPNSSTNTLKLKTWYGVYSLGVPGTGGVIKPGVEEAKPGKKYYFCFNHGIHQKQGDVGGPVVDYSHYYKVQLFYKMDLPVLGDLATFMVEGTTAEIFNPYCGDDVMCSM